MTFNIVEHDDLGFLVDQRVHEPHVQLRQRPFGVVHVRVRLPVHQMLDEPETRVVGTFTVGREILQVVSRGNRSDVGRE